MLLADLFLYPTNIYRSSSVSLYVAIFGFQEDLQLIHITTIKHSYAFVSLPYWQVTTN